MANGFRISGLRDAWQCDINSRFSMDAAGYDLMMARWRPTRPPQAYSGSVGRKRNVVKPSAGPASSGVGKRGWGCGGRGWRLNPLPPPSTPYPRSAGVLRSGSAWRPYHRGASVTRGGSGCIWQGKCLRPAWSSAPAATNLAGRQPMSTRSLSSSGSALFPQRILRIRRAVPRLNYKPFAEAKPAGRRPHPRGKGDES